MGVLEVKNLSIGYRNKDQVKVIQHDINVSLEKGQIISLMGQNGVGKTTFIKTISGLLDQLGGEILYGGKSVEKLSKLELAQQLSVVLTEKPYSQTFPFWNLSPLVDTLIQGGWAHYLYMIKKSLIGLFLKHISITWRIGKYTS